MSALLLSLWFAFFGASPNSADEAERHYHAGDFAAAQTSYESLLDAPDVSPAAVFHNLGNCAYRQGHYAEAIFHYRRALHHRSGEAETTANLRLAEQQLGIDPPNGDSLATALQAMVQSLTPKQWLLLVAGLQLVGLFGLLFFRRKRGLRLTLVLLVLLGLAGGIRLIATELATSPRLGVVLAREILLRSDPHQDLPVTFELAAGETVQVTEMSDRWVLLTHPKGRGWTERQGIGLVDE